MDELLNPSTSRGQLLKRAIYPEQESLTEEQVSDILRSIMVQYMGGVTAHDPGNNKLRELLEKAPLFIRTVDDMKHAAHPTEEHPSPIPDKVVELSQAHLAFTQAASRFLAPAKALYNAVDKVDEAKGFFDDEFIENMSSLARLSLSEFSERVAAGTLATARQTCQNALKELKALKKHINDVPEKHAAPRGITLQQHLDDATEAAQDLLKLLKPPLTQQSMKDALNAGREAEKAMRKADEGPETPTSSGNKNFGAG